jgi:hypothetical protein
MFLVVNNHTKQITTTWERYPHEERRRADKVI